ncbi:hypothetical protein [Streptomyces sp. NRRL F-5123]|uniref:hypothetical protein n=1 Tax=Streptomyces sp. NRRL F-5123 TaxID=1463856 RepID=UPI0004E285AC|nr:hypothetical protein [Streptomyces sp. NRRL F-5123]
MSIASRRTRKGVCDRVGVLDGERPVLAISRTDVRPFDDPTGEDHYRVRTLDRWRDEIWRGHASQLRDALLAADRQLLSRGAAVEVEVRRGSSTVALLTRRDLGRLWPGRGARTASGA